MKSTFRTASFLIALCFTSITTLYAAPGDEWNSGKQFHIPVSGAPLQTEGNPVEGNPWEYGFRMARGYNDGKWSHMDAGSFEPFGDFDELGHSVFGGADSGADLNRWWVPFPPPEGQVHVGRVVHAEGDVEAGPEKYLAGQVHLLTDDDAPTTGIVSLRWSAPDDGVFNISAKLETRLDVDEKAQRDPFYHFVVNGVMIDEGQREQLTLEGVTLSAGDAVEICASTGVIVFPFGLLATDVTIRKIPDAMANVMHDQLRAYQAELEQGAEPVVEITDGHSYALAMAKAADWIKQNLGAETIGLPISFTYGGKQMFRSPYGGHRLPPDSLRGWKTKRTCLCSAGLIQTRDTNLITLT
jgi:hypothetical protein